MKFENRKTLLSLIHNKRLEEVHIEEALKLAGTPPSLHGFLSFLRLILIWVGALSLVMALLLFMAFNWQDLGRFSKFMMVEVSMFAAITIYYVASQYERVQQIALMLASITLGILLALIGQTYQTGADPWQLFALWALLMTPWAIVARASAVWILWIVLVNVGAVLYYQKFDLSWFLLFEVRDNLLLLLFGINAFLWLAWRYLAPKYETFNQALTVRFLAFLTVSAISTLAIINLYNTSEMTLAYMLLYIAFLSLLYYVHRVRQIDMYMMSLFAMSLFFFLLNVVFRFIALDGVSDITSFLFILIVSIAGLTIAIISWMKKLKKELSMRKEQYAKS